MRIPAIASILQSPPTATTDGPARITACGGKGVIEAIDYKTGKIRWTHEGGRNGDGAGVMTTDSGLTFTGDEYGNLLAIDTRTGKTLWHAGTGAGMQTSPITYELDGRQYVVTGSGSVLFAWALPLHSTKKSASLR